jgi:ribosomal protein S18 acetylase RimI-like enzyme
VGTLHEGSRSMQMNATCATTDRPDIVIRPYEGRDRAAVHRIAAETAFFGEPIETYLDGRRPFQDLFVAAYTDHESGHAWVGELDGQVVGYLTGCPESARLERTLLSNTLPKVLLRALRGRYRLGRKTARYVVRLVVSLLRGEWSRVDLALYPAHLHINVGAGWRGQGVGRELMAAYLDQLRQEGVAGVHLGTTTLNRAALGLYLSAGFKLLSAHPSRMWEGIIAEKVENLSFGLRLESPAD